MKDIDKNSLIRIKFVCSIIKIFVIRIVNKLYLRVFKNIFCYIIEVIWYF